MPPKPTTSSPLKPFSAKFTFCAFVSSLYPAKDMRNNIPARYGPPSHMVARAITTMTAPLINLVQNIRIPLSRISQAGLRYCKIIVLKA